MKICFILFIIAMTAIKGFAQVSKIYITPNNRYSDDGNNAVSYILVKKTPDSLYFVQQFDMQDSIMMEATYKDKQLSVQQGEYKLYRFEKPVQKVRFDYVTKRLDTIRTPDKNYLSTKGYYANGIKEGQWLDYYGDGGIKKLNTYKDDKLNGVFKTFNLDNKVAMEGSYLLGRQSGIWYTLTFKNDTSVTDYYTDGVLKKHISHLSDKKFKSRLKSATPPFELTEYLNKKLPLSDRARLLKGYNGQYTFTLTADGKLLNAIALNVIDLKIDTDIIEAILAGPNWRPAAIDGKPVESDQQINVGLLRRGNNGDAMIAYPLTSIVKDYTGY